MIMPQLSNTVLFFQKRISVCTLLGQNNGLLAANGAKFDPCSLPA